MSNVIIRQYKSTDLSQCISIGKELHAESQYSTIQYSPQRVTDELAKLDGINSELFLAEDMNNEIVGFIYLCSSKCFFADVRIATDLGLYVKPWYRRTIVPIKLVLAAETWAKNINAQSLVLGVTAPKDPEKVTRFFEKLSFTRWGLFVRKEL